MKAAILNPGRNAAGHFLEIKEIERPQVRPGYVSLRVLACGVCRTDLHIAEGELPPIKSALVPGHQIVGEVVEGATAELLVWHARGSVVDGRHRRDLLVLPTRHGEPV